MPLDLPLICVVTRARGVRGSQEQLTLLRRLSSAVEAGASMIQVRERHMDDRSLLDFVRKLMSLTSGTSCSVLVNDRADIVLAAGAHGVHLKSDSISVADARRILPTAAIVGRSVHGEDEASAIASAGGCDYLIFGTVYPSSSKAEDHPVAGLDALSRVCRSVPLPVVAIGGISISRAEEVRLAGAAGIAAISLFTEAPDPGRVVDALRNALTVKEGNVKLAPHD
jgi:thiamine-phosphate diphosphorylase